MIECFDGSKLRRMLVSWRFSTAAPAYGYRKGGQMGVNRSTDLEGVQDTTKVSDLVW